MHTLLRRIRGVLVTALLWGIAWLPVGLAVGIYRALTISIDFGAGFYWRIISGSALVWAVWGAISGAVFATLLALLERRRNVDTLSSRRTAVWGALGAMAVPGTVLIIVLARLPGFYLIQPALWTLSISAVQGGVCAFATLALAKRGQRLPPAASDIGSLTS